jgi:hypothetical protein
MLKNNDAYLKRIVSTSENTADSRAFARNFPLYFPRISNTYTQSLYRKLSQYQIKKLSFLLWTASKPPGKISCKSSAANPTALFFFPNLSQKERS